MLHQEPNRVTTRLLTRQKPHYMPIRIYLPEKLARVCVCVCGRRGGLASLQKKTSMCRSHTGLLYRERMFIHLDIYYALPLITVRFVSIVFPGSY